VGSDKTTKVLIVDDCAVFRKIAEEALSGLSNVTVVGTAANGEIALDCIDRYQPDVVTLDLEMPLLDGFAVLTALRQRSKKNDVIVLTGTATVGGQEARAAMQLGSVDFVPKPCGVDPAANASGLRRTLSQKIRRLAQGKTGSPNEASKKKPTPRGLPLNRPILEPPPVYVEPSPPTGVVPTRFARKQIEVVAIGVSTGGPESLREIIPNLPKDFPVPIVIVQQMPAGFTSTVASDLSELGHLPVREANFDQLIRNGHVYIAPGGRHLAFRRDGNDVFTVLTDEPPLRSCRPSVDYTFSSIADVWQGNVLAVIMTGMGDDGCEGCRRLKDLGANIVTQDEKTCVVYGMPRGVNEAGLADQTCRLDQLSSVIVRSVMRGLVTCQ
jgi:two-component system chemotaxis response regulator CheB